MSSLLEETTVANVAEVYSGRDARPEIGCPAGDVDAPWNAAVEAIQASWRYLNYSRQWHACGDHFAGVRDRISATLAYNRARLLQRYCVSPQQSVDIEEQLHDLAVALHS